MVNNELVKQAIALLQQALNETEPTPGPIEPPFPVEPPVAAITSVSFQSLSDKPQETVPFTFGQVFRVGDMRAGSGLAGRFDNGDKIPLQVDVKALHADGSVRHAIISGIHSALFGKETRKMELIPAPAGTESHKPDGKMPVGRVEITVNGEKYATSGNNILKHSMWLEGQFANEIHATLALVNDKSMEHPHIHARAKLREYSNGTVRLDLTIENDWAYEKDPQNFTYDVLVDIGGKKVYEQKALMHYHHARWRKVFWIGNEPQMHIRHDARDIIETRALANYDDITIAQTAIDSLAKEANSDKFKAFGIGYAASYMPNTGGRRDIGLLPQWAVVDLLSQDPGVRKGHLGTADLAGSWSIHYRDQKTDQPISIIDFPYMTILGRSSDTNNPKTGNSEAFPKVIDGKTPYTHDSDHQPNLAYLAYMITGDYYYLEELQFWAMYNVFSRNPNYREREKGLVWRAQVRDEAWSMRSLAEAAYITPDNDRLKSHFTNFVDNNLAWYNKNFTDNPNANKLGANDSLGSFAYPKSGPNKLTGISSWQDDFLTQAIGHVADLGFKEAERYLAWKVKFPIGRMIGEGVDPSGAMGADESGALLIKLPDETRFTTPKQVYEATMNNVIGKVPSMNSAAQAIGVAAGSMQGYANSAIGYPSNMQPALAYAYQISDEGKQAWKRFMQRSQIPNYSSDPQFAIVPRQ